MPAIRGYSLAAQSCWHQAAQHEAQLHEVDLARDAYTGTVQFDLDVRLCRYALTMWLDRL
ncbi:hypothetical protein WT24_11565 [Burkholderia sp. MSMB1078WGS]|nr:hypothetical protein WT24_11565 [Burkholderia sp. MSMB1078WGS]